MSRIKNIIFDLGGVLLNIDYNKSIVAFEKIGIKNFQQMFSQAKVDAVFDDLETGKLSEEDFYKIIKERTKIAATNEQIAAAWNALILGFRIESLDFLEKISGQYKLYLLSNTNSIHLKYFQEIFTQETGKPSLDDHFIKAWYSHQIGLRKPEKEIFEFVLEEANLLLEETLFIDDTISNIETAAAMGIKTRFLKDGERIEDMLG